MASVFEAKKKRILQQLDVPDVDYQDASPKGSVDINIRGLVADINSQDGFVTTSSCGGRVAVYCEGSVKANAGGKGGGNWLFTSHEQVDTSTSNHAGELFRLIGLPVEVAVSVPIAVTSASFIHFKFEPMRAQTAAMDAGFRESGISGIHPSGNKPIMPMVAVRTTGLAFDCIIACKEITTNGNTRTVPMVSEAYVHTLFSIANERFRLNDERKERFQKSFLNRVQQ
nr:trna wybutosine-synthesizing protein 3 [Quercus suber]